MKRQIALDTETTGLEVAQGHRIIEIACLELLDRRPTGHRFHYFINPERPIDAGATRVHGITDEDVAEAPLFHRIVDELLEFVRDAEILIHNAPFDLGFLNAELALCERGKFESHCAKVIDTLKLARDMRPGKSNALDALCRAYEIDNTARTMHGALLDAQLLADVYIAMTRGQESLMMDLQMPARTGVVSVLTPMATAALRVPLAQAEELAAHSAVLNEIEQESKGKCLWKTSSI